MSIADHVTRMVEVMREVRRRAPWNAKPAAPDYESILQDLSATIGYGDLMDSLQKSPGWKMIEQRLRTRRAELSDSVKTVKHKDLIRLQADLESLDYLLDIVPSAIKDGIAAKERKNSLLEWVQEQAKENSEDE